MESRSLRSKVFWSFSIQAILLLCMNSQYESVPTSNLGNHSDLLALLAFKDGITRDPLRVMSSWNDSLHFCNWIGVECSPSKKRVTVLNLGSQGLGGRISPSIGNLTFLTEINLQNNSFNGEIPQEIGRLSRLQYLNLEDNSIGGQIPTNLTHCTGLIFLDVISNDLVGIIPDQLSSLSKIVQLLLAQNSLTGSIPPWIGNLSSLVTLALGNNNLQGRIPDDLGRLSKFGLLAVDVNNLSGMIPSTLYNISSIYTISVTQNQLHGQFPPDLGLTLPNLEVFAGGVNNFTGPIPVSLSNASKLQVVDFEQNRLTGPVPVDLGSLQDLYRFNFGTNRLGTRGVGDLNFLNSMVNCSSLDTLAVNKNNLGGELPNSVSNLTTQLRYLLFSYNWIHGSIPTGIENLVNLDFLALASNLFTGSIPTAIGKLHNLRKLHLHSNRFSGLIPSTLGNLTLLISLQLYGTALEGSIPPSLGECQNLLSLDLSYNNLNGSIPKQVIGLSSLSILFSLAHNSFTGSLPLEVGKLTNLVQLELFDNKLSGKLPRTLGSCMSLKQLLIEGNFFQGTIPLAYSTLRGLEDLDLSRNNLSGVIPEYLRKLPFLKYLNLSFNDFEGEVPREGIFTNASAISVLGNNLLCGGIPELQLPACSRQSPHTLGKFLAPKIIIPIAIVVLVLVLMSCFFATVYWRRNSIKKTSATSSSEDWQSGVSFAELFKSTDGFSTDNLIGVGSFGSVYKGVLCNSGEVFAVKVLKLHERGASKSFIAECKALRNIRHRNLVKILTVCSSVDFDGSDFKALVFQFMPNGSLDQWLHPRVDRQHQTVFLNFTQRLNIAIDVASALEYLHYRCQTTIVHCDLKPSNVLLDEDMTAHLGDFGLAQFLFEATDGSSKSQTISVGLKGSIGYVPPEYGMGGQVSILGDVYSYGILLLEMFTGKRPTDDLFKDGLNLHQFTAMALPGHVMKIVDPLLPFEKDEEEVQEENDIEKAAIIQEEIRQSSIRGRVQECLVSVIRIGLSCTTPSPRDRMVMTDVVNELHTIRDLFIRFQNKNRS